MADAKDQAVDSSSSAPSSDDNTKKASLEDLLSTLSKQINTSDWLEQNTPEKFAAENPEVAQVYADISNSKKLNDAGGDKS